MLRVTVLGILANQRAIVDIHIEILVPVGVERLLDHARRVGLFSIYSDDRKRVWEPEDLALRQTIGGDDYKTI